MDEYDPPNESPTPGDAVHKDARTVISAVPVIGGTGVELFESVFRPPLEQRQQAWRERIGRGLSGLEGRVEGLEEQLRENQAFIDTSLQATQVALRSSQEEKLEALTNAVLNSALPAAPRQALQQMFLSYIDTFTVWHLEILRLFEDPVAWGEEHGSPFRDRSMGSLAQVLEEAFPQLRGQREFYDQVWRDLDSRGLLTTSSLHTMGSWKGSLVRRTTEMGSEFVRFISQPRLQNP